MISSGAVMVSPWFGLRPDGRGDTGLRKSVTPGADGQHWSEGTAEANGAGKAIDADTG
jgi:hypothetical protein